MTIFGNPPSQNLLSSKDETKRGSHDTAYRSGMRGPNSLVFQRVTIARIGFNFMVGDGKLRAVYPDVLLH